MIPSRAFIVMLLDAAAPAMAAVVVSEPVETVNDRLPVPSAVFPELAEVLNTAALIAMLLALAVKDTVPFVRATIS